MAGTRSGTVDATGARLDFKESRGSAFAHSFHSSTPLTGITVTVQLGSGPEEVMAVADDAFDLEISAAAAAALGFGTTYKVFLTYLDGLKTVELYGRIDFV